VTAIAVYNNIITGEDRRDDGRDGYVALFYSLKGNIILFEQSSIINSKSAFEPFSIL